MNTNTMPRKTLTTTQRIEREFTLWLGKNPTAKKKLRVAAFDRIADKHQKVAA